MSIYLAEVDYYDIAGASAGTLYYGTHGFVTEPGDSPANTHFDERIKQPALLTRHMFGRGRVGGATRRSPGQLVLYNDDGDLDDLIGYAFDGRDVTIWWAESRKDSFPGDFEEVMVATMAGPPEFIRNEVRFQLRDRQELVDVPIQTTRYAGDNALPAGLEGVEDLKGKPKPLCFGRVRNVPAVLVNSAKLIYQVNDGTVDSIDRVFDSGIRLGAPLHLSTATEPFTDIVRCVAYGAGTFVCGVDGGVLGYSTDAGANWSVGDSTIFGDTSDDVNDIHYADGLFVAVGNTGILATSTDGQSWTERTSSFGTTGIRAVTWGKGIWVAAGVGKVATSSDGTSWTQVTSPGTSAIVSATYGAGTFVLLEQSGGCSHSDNPATSWSSVDNGMTAGDAVAWGDGLFVSTGQVSGPSGAFSVSPDATAWEVVHEAPNALSINGVGWHKNVGWIAFSPHLWQRDRDSGDWTRRTIVALAGLSVARDMAFEDDSEFGAVVFAGNGGIVHSGSPPSYSSEADLLDDDLQPEPGSYKPYPAGGYFRLGSPPAGKITADVTQGDAASDRTAAELFRQLLIRAGQGKENELGDPEDLSGASWTQLGCTIQSDQMTGPDGASSLDRITENSNNTNHGVTQTVTLTADGKYAFGFWAVADERDVILVRLRNGANIVGIRFDLANGVTATPSEGGAGSLDHVAIVDWSTIQSGLYFCRLLGSVNAGVTSIAADVMMLENLAGSSSYTGDGSSGLFVGFAYLEDDVDFAYRWAYPDLFDLDASKDHVLGLWTGLQEKSCIEAADEVARSVLAWWGVDRKGRFRIQEFTDPDGETPELTLTDNDIIGWPERIRSKGRDNGVPIYRSVVRYQKNHTVQNEVAAGVGDARKGVLSKEWREETDEDTSIQDAHLLAKEESTETLLDSSADAASEATDRLTLFGEQRDTMEVVVPITTETVQRDLGSVVQLESKRYGLSAGGGLQTVWASDAWDADAWAAGAWGGVGPLLVVGVEPDGARKRVRWEVWR